MYGLIAGDEAESLTLLTESLTKHLFTAVRLQHYITGATGKEQPQPMAAGLCLWFPGGGEGGLLSNKPC